MTLRVTFAVLFPYTASPLPEHKEKFERPKDYPPSYELDIEFEVQRAETVVKQEVTVQRQATIIDQSVMSVEHTYELPDKLTRATIDLKNQLNTELRDEALQLAGYTGELTEEYVVLQIITDKNPDTIVKENQFAIARFLRYIDTRLSDEEVKEILATHIHHGEDYLAVVDWEGAVLISAEENFASDLDLFIIGNYQLLRYRMLDELIDRRLQDAQRLINSKKRYWLSADGLMHDLINAELSLLLDYDKIDQSILLIGDWYSGKLYRAITDEFYLQDWRANVKSKLETLTQAEVIVREKYSISWERLLDFVQLFGWLILLIGYFVLFYLDLS